MTPGKSCCRPQSPISKYHFNYYSLSSAPLSTSCTPPPKKKTVTSQYYDVLERGDILPLSALTFGSLGSCVSWVVVMLLYDGSMVLSLLLGFFLLPPLPRTGAAQAHLLCGSQVQMALVLAPAIPRLLLRLSFRYPAPVTISERNSLFYIRCPIQASFHLQRLKLLIKIFY